MEDLEERPESAVEVCDKCPHAASVAIYSGKVGLPALYCGCCLGPVWRGLERKKTLIVVPLTMAGMVNVYRGLVLSIEKALPDDAVDRIRREVQRGGAS